MTTQRAERVFLIAHNTNPDGQYLPHTSDGERIAAIQRELDAEREEAGREWVQSFASQLNDRGKSPSPAPRTVTEAEDVTLTASWLRDQVRGIDDVLRRFNTRIEQLETYHRAMKEAHAR